MLYVALVICPATQIYLHILVSRYLSVAGGIGIIRQSNGNYLLGNKDSSGLFLVVTESDYALFSYNMIYGSVVNYNRIAGELSIENVNSYGTVVSSNGIGFYAVRFER